MNVLSLNGIKKLNTNKLIYIDALMSDKIIN